MKDEFDAQFEEERRELAELEYAKDVPVDLEDEELEVVICTCKIDPRFCEMHILERDDEKE